MTVHALPSYGESAPIGIGFYTVPEAARLLRMPARTINRWLGGYRDGQTTEIPPLWRPELPRADDHIELGFRDLIELRFVKAFLEADLGLITIRNCIASARECVGDDRPFSTRRFRTDGRTIFLDSLKRTGETELLDLKKRQYVFKAAIERTFKDLDLAEETVTRWRPFQGKPSIVVDPKRAFGQPIAAQFGVPTVVLAESAKAEGSSSRTAFVYDVPVSVVNDAIQFERFLQAT